MVKFIMMVGVAGSGKSTYAKGLESSGQAIIVSTDAIRGELWGDENDQQNPAKVFEEAHRRIKYLLKSGHSVVFDATNLSARRREGFLKQLPKDCYKECVVIITPPEVINARMAYRERKVPPEVIEKQIKSFQCPYYYEGWDNIEIRWDFECALEDAEHYFALCEKTENDNHNHSTANVNEHIDMATLYFGVNYAHRRDLDVKSIAEAVKFHDIGKPQTKVFHNAKGEPTDEAHYYGHQNYSAYIYLMTHMALLYDEVYADFVLRIANLIQFHMEHFFRDENGIEKFYKKTGFGKELEVIRRCDMAAH